MTVTMSITAQSRKKNLPILEESFHCIHGPFHAHVVARTRTFGPLPLAWVALNSVSRLNHFSDQLRKWRKLFLLDQIKFLDKKYEVFEGCVEMRLLLKRLHLFKMVMIDMSVNPEKTFKDGFCALLKVFLGTGPLFSMGKAFHYLVDLAPTS